jgi:hypothetical protein
MCLAIDLSNKNPKAKMFTPARTQFPSLSEKQGPGREQGAGHSKCNFLSYRSRRNFLKAVFLAI